MTPAERHGYVHQSLIFPIAVFGATLTKPCRHCVVICVRGINEANARQAQKYANCIDPELEI
jgi:hypothetical protein